MTGPSNSAKYEEPKHSSVKPAQNRTGCKSLMGSESVGMLPRMGSSREEERLVWRPQRAKRLAGKKRCDEEAFDAVSGGGGHIGSR
jgi:hypothetical protein